MTDNDVQRDLRSYFHDIAADRPADGELERVIAATARIHPRPAWQVQLEAAVEALRAPTIGGLQFATWLALLLLTLALLALGFAVASRPSASTPFEGRWVAVDVGDGSRMLLIVSGGESPSVHYEDEYASSCAAAGDANTHFLAQGLGDVEGDRLNVQFSEAGCTSYQLPDYAETLDRDPASNTLTDAAGSIWHRPSP